MAALKKHHLEGLEIDPPHEEVRWGSIYWGRVRTIDTSIDAAYIDLDGDNIGILHNADVREIDPKGRVKKGGSEAIGKMLRPGQMIAVQAKSGYLLQDGDQDLPVEDKSPKLSMDITIQGRYLIYSPMMDQNRISTRIRDKKLRKQMMKMLDSIGDIKGCILRAAAAHTQTDMLIREGKILNTIWSQLQEHLAGDDSGLIMLGPDAMQRSLSDQAGKIIDYIEIVTMEQYENVEEWCEIYAPDLVTKIKPVEMDDPYADLALFDHRDMLDQIEELFRPYAILPHGGSVIIQETAALTAIDVNRSGDRRSNLDVNIEAAEEIARQLRLRNLGGILVIDFLKLKSRKEQNVLIGILEEKFDEDPCTVQIHGMTALGLIEITRKRRTPALQERFNNALE